MKQKVFRLTKIRFSEVSAVDRPANDFATVESIAMVKGQVPAELQTPAAKTLLAKFSSWAGGLFRSDGAKFDVEKLQSVTTSSHSPHSQLSPLVLAPGVAMAKEIVSKAKEKVRSKSKPSPASKDWKIRMSEEVLYALSRDMLFKSLGTVGFLANVVYELDCICTQVATEMSTEHDENPVLDELCSLRDELGAALVSLAEHEVEELTGHYQPESSESALEATTE